MTPEQVQDFYPTPGTVSTSMYYTGLDPFTGHEVYVPKTMEEKAMQRALLQSHIPEMRKTVEKALKILGRNDLIGTGPDCLIRPFNITQGGKNNGTDTKRKSSFGQNKGGTKGRGSTIKGKGNIPGSRRNNRGR